jgi:hypothetical protein
MSKLTVYVILIVSLFALVTEVQAHGYLAVPVSRNALHQVYNMPAATCPVPNTCVTDCPYPTCRRVNEDGQAYNNVNGLSSGGPAWVYDASVCGPSCGRSCGCQGRHNMCGDDTSTGGAQKNREGGVYSTGHINGVYRVGQNISINVIVTANHCGYFEFFLYHIPDSSDFTVPYNESAYPRYTLIQTVQERDKTVSLYQQKVGNPPNLLYDVIDPATQWVIPNNECTDRDYLTRRSYNLRYKLPAGVRCKRCVLQWHYMTANQGSATANPEEFWNCADITIVDPSDKVVFINDRDFPSYNPTGALKSPVPPTTGGSGSTSSSSTSGHVTTGSSTSGSTTGGDNCGTIHREVVRVDVWETGAEWKVTFKNFGAFAVHVRFALTPAANAWDVEKDYDGTYILPSWMPNGLEAGTTFTWGYISAGPEQHKFVFLTPGDC